MFEGFATRRVDLGQVSIQARIGGAGPPLLLLHGYPQTHAMWNRVALRLARRFTLVCADLRGYGESAKPAGDAGHERYSKRAMAEDQRRLMQALGFERFAVAGHDRGGRVAHRLCLDHPERVVRAAVLDIVPTAAVFGRMDKTVAMGFWHWLFLAQPRDLPERLIGADAPGFLESRLARWGGGLEAFEPEALEHYRRSFDAASIHGSCEDYRAGAGIDLEHDEADRRAGHKIECPLLVLWGARGLVESAFDVLATWRDYAHDVRGFPLDAGHFLAEERPEETARALEEFFAG